jgi:hypothetical protein
MPDYLAVDSGLEESRREMLELCQRQEKSSPSRLACSREKSE